MRSRIEVSRRSFLAGCATGAAAMALRPELALAKKADAAPAKRPDSPLAMWALTGTLASDLVRRHLDLFHQAGWGVVLYPRWGLDIDYLSDLWFQRIRYIVEQAAARKMEVWLYDEFCWPSGHAKGLVTKDHPELEAQLLQVERDGQSRIVTVPESANLLHRASTDRFLALTHDRYAATLREFMGSTVRAIFTDEPSLAQQHKPRPKGQTGWDVTWSEEMDKALGGDFRKRLAASGDASKPELWRDYWAAFAKIFHDCWVEPIAKRCHEHKFEMSGHFLGEHGFGSQVAYNGSLRRQQAALGIPGIDEIGTRSTPEKCEALTLASIAELEGRERMVEVFALGPANMNMGTMKQMIDLCACCGVDRYIFAICPLDFRGAMFKREYCGTYGPQQPWFREAAKALTEHVAEAAEVARKAKPLGVAWPSDEELWAVAGPAPGKSEALKDKTKRFAAAAIEAIKARVEPGSIQTAPTSSGTPLKADWTLKLKTPNSIRLDSTSLAILALPPSVSVSIQSQLVRSLRINGKPVAFESAPWDSIFDASYKRVNITSLLRVGENSFEVDKTEVEPIKFLPSLILWGQFSVDERGRLAKFNPVVQPGDWRTQGLPSFCGTARYSATVNFDKPPARLCVDTGGYPVRATCNGQDLGLRPWAPWAFDLKGVARPGRNQLTFEVTSTLGHLFIAKDSPRIGLFGSWIEG